MSTSVEVVILVVTYYASRDCRTGRNIICYDTAVISGAINSLTSYFHLSPCFGDRLGGFPFRVVVGCAWLVRLAPDIYPKRFGTQEIIDGFSAVIHYFRSGHFLLHVHPFCDLSHYQDWQSARRQQYHRCICSKVSPKTCAAEHYMQQFAIVFGLRSDFLR